MSQRACHSVSLTWPVFPPLSEQSAVTSSTSRSRWLAFRGCAVKNSKTRSGHHTVQSFSPWVSGTGTEWGQLNWALPSLSGHIPCECLHRMMGGLPLCFVYKTSLMLCFQPHLQSLNWIHDAERSNIETHLNTPAPKHKVLPIVVIWIFANCILFFLRFIDWLILSWPLCMAHHGMWDLGSLTRDQTCDLYSGITES